MKDAQVVVVVVAVAAVVVDGDDKTHDDVVDLDESHAVGAAGAAAVGGGGAAVSFHEGSVCQVQPRESRQELDWKNVETRVDGQIVRTITQSIRPFFRRPSYCASSLLPFLVPTNNIFRTVVAIPVGVSHFDRVTLPIIQITKPLQISPRP